MVQLKFIIHSAVKETESLLLVFERCLVALLTFPLSPLLVLTLRGSPDLPLLSLGLFYSQSLSLPTFQLHWISVPRLLTFLCSVGPMGMTFPIVEMLSPCFLPSLAFSPVLGLVNTHFSSWGETIYIFHRYNNAKHLVFGKWKVLWRDGFPSLYLPWPCISYVPFHWWYQ